MTNVSMDDIKKLVGLQLGAREVEEDSQLVEDLSAESADVANIVAVLEEKYQIKVKETEMVKLHTPTDLFELVKKHISLRGQ
jgi:acyl carrier protein